MSASGVCSYLAGHRVCIDATFGKYFSHSSPSCHFILCIFSVSVVVFTSVDCLCDVCEVMTSVVVRPRRSTTYVDVAYCYRPSSVVCHSVCLSH